MLPESAGIANPRAYWSSDSTSDWVPVPYGDRAPRKGKRADEYHAQRLFPSYGQFAKTKTGPTMTDHSGREYQVADGTDRKEDELGGYVSKGSPYQVLPILFKDPITGEEAVRFPGIDQVASPIDFVNVPRKKQVSLRKVGKAAIGLRSLSTSGSTYGISRGTQLLYVRIPVSERKDNPELSLPGLGDVIKFYHYGTGSIASGVISEVDGGQFPRTATGSVLVKDLTFFISPSTFTSEE